MSKSPYIFETESDLLNYYTNKYYESLSESPTVRHDEEKHLKLINRINSKYQVALSKPRYNFNFELYKDCFLENIDHLTQALTNKKISDEKNKKKKEFRESVLNLK